MKELLSIEDPIAGLLGAWSAGLNLGSALLRIALIVALAASIGCERSSKRHSAGLTAAAGKSSAGAAVCLPVVRAANIVAAVKKAIERK